jgi:hypothetical protein
VCGLVLINIVTVMEQVDDLPRLPQIVTHDGKGQGYIDCILKQTEMHPRPSYRSFSLDRTLHRLRQETVVQTLYDRFEPSIHPDIRQVLPGLSPKT